LFNDFDLLFLADFFELFLAELFLLDFLELFLLDLFLGDGPSEELSSSEKSFSI